MRRQRPTTWPRRRRHAMTLVELSVGLLITTIVIGALSSVWIAVGDTWRKSSSSQTQTLRTSQAVTRLEGVFRQAKYVCQLTPGSATDATAAPASAFFWRLDYWNAAGDVSNPATFATAVPDNLVQVAELSLVEYDAAAKRLYLYQAKDPAAMNSTERAAAGTVWTWTDLSKSSNLTVFKGLSYVQRKVLSEGIAGAAFNMPTATAGGRPIIEFTLTIPQTGGNALIYSVASLRAPAARPL
jgi:Tfp pilus assembly protein PilW